MDNGKKAGGCGLLGFGVIVSLLGVFIFSLKKKVLLGEIVGLESSIFGFLTDHKTFSRTASTFASTEYLIPPLISWGIIGLGIFLFVKGLQRLER